MQLNTRLIATESELAPFLRFWQDAAPTPFQSPQWMLNWWNAFGSNQRLAVLVVQSADGETVGLAPFFVREHWLLGRCLRLLGSGRTCTDFQTVISRPETAELVAHQIADTLVSNRRHLNWAYVELEGIQSQDPAVRSFTDRMSRQGCRFQSTPLENTWRVDLSEGWSAFMKNLSRNQRRQDRNLVNRFDKSPAMSLEVIEDPETLPHGLETLIRLHQKRWQAANQSGCFADPRFESFLRSAVNSFADQRQIKLLTLQLEGRPVAAQLFFQDHEHNVFLYQSGRDPDFDDARVGRILNLVSIRYLCESGIRSLDYMRGDEVYKSRMKALPSSCSRYRFVAAATVPQLRHSTWNIGRHLRSQAQSIVSRWSPTNSELPNAEPNVNSKCI